MSAPAPRAGADPWHGDRRQRAYYGVHALLLGVPVLWFGGGFSVLGLYYGLMVPSVSWFCMSLMGAAGLVSWLRLSIAFLRRGRFGLAQASRFWWLGVCAGVLAAIWMLFSILWGPSVDTGPRPPGEWIIAIALMLGAGPGLFPPVLHLAWLAWSARRRWPSGGPLGDTAARPPSG